MAKTKTFFVCPNSPTLYTVGQIGIDDENTDAATTAYTATIETERQYPAGRDALIHFRRVAIRVNRNAAAKLTLKIFVDEVQTQIYTGSTLGNQTIVFDLTETGEREDVLEADLSAVGASIRCLITILSTDIDGYFLLEPIEAHGRVLKSARARTAEAT
jgi:hypothetical protein